MEGKASGAPGDITSPPPACSVIGALSATSTAGNGDEVSKGLAAEPLHHGKCSVKTRKCSGFLF